MQTKFNKDDFPCISWEWTRNSTSHNLICKKKSNIGLVRSAQSDIEPSLPTEITRSTEQLLIPAVATLQPSSITTCVHVVRKSEISDGPQSENKLSIFISIIKKQNNSISPPGFITYTCTWLHPDDEFWIGHCGSQCCGEFSYGLVVQCRCLWKWENSCCIFNCKTYTLLRKRRMRGLP